MKKNEFFPHLFNTEDNQNYNGTWPDQPDFMSKSKRDKFFEWYEQYFFSDVDILTEGCKRY
jgi:hypothetical protein